jgi:15-cis-phytoene synthase
MSTATSANATDVPGREDLTTAAPVGLERSREYCAQLTRQAARNFYYGLKLLPEPKRSAMFALYAYMRLTDDIADAGLVGEAIDLKEPESVAADPAEVRMELLEAWRGRTHAALRGELGWDGHCPLWPAFAEVARHYNLTADLFDEVIAGQEQDLRPEVFDNFEQLERYCYRVAGVVGLASIRIWGYEGGPETEKLAIDRGVAFQLTNILRDLREDAAGGRIYLPREDLRIVGVSEDELLSCRGGEAFLDLMGREIDRARSYYDRSAALESRVHPDSRPTLIAMTEIYRGLLDKIAADPMRVLRERVSLSLLSKLRIGWRATRSVRKREPAASA